MLVQTDQIDNKIASPYNPKGKNELGYIDKIIMVEFLGTLLCGK